MKRMLVCTDLSPESDTVLKGAEELRVRNNGTIDLLYVSDLGFHLSGVMDVQKTTYREAFLGDLKSSIETKLREQVSRCQINCKTLFLDGEVSETINTVSDQGYDLIVMGHGRKSLFKKLLGSNAQKMISHTTLPLMIIKEPPKFGKVAGLIDESRPVDRTIIGTFDFYRNYKCDCVEFISLWLDFPEPFGNSKGGDVQNKIKEEVQHFAKDGENFNVRVGPTREVNVAEPLNEILQSEKVDFVVLKKFSHETLKRIYIGSTTKRLLELFEGNLLVLPP